LRLHAGFARGLDEVHYRVGDQNCVQRNGRQDIRNKFGAGEREKNENSRRGNYAEAPRRMGLGVAPSQERQKQRPWKQTQKYNRDVVINRLAMAIARLKDAADILTQEIEIEKARHPKRNADKPWRRNRERDCEAC
jgi:hypothetical protein